MLFFHFGSNAQPGNNPKIKQIRDAIANPKYITNSKTSLSQKQHKFNMFLFSFLFISDGLHATTIKITSKKGYPTNLNI